MSDSERESAAMAERLLGLLFRPGAEVIPGHRLWRLLRAPERVLFLFDPAQPLAASALAGCAARELMRRHDESAVWTVVVHCPAGDDAASLRARILTEVLPDLRDELRPGALVVLDGAASPPATGTAEHTCVLDGAAAERFRRSARAGLPELADAHAWVSFWSTEDWAALGVADRRAVLDAHDQVWLSDAQHPWRKLEAREIMKLAVLQELAETDYSWIVPRRSTEDLVACALVPACLPRTIVITAEPGSGKTTFLEQIIRRWAKGDDAFSRHVFVPMFDVMLYIDKSDEELLSAIRQRVDELAGAPGVFDRLSGTHSVVAVFDGFPRDLPWDTAQADALVELSRRVACLPRYGISVLTSTVTSLGTAREGALRIHELLLSVREELGEGVLGVVHLEPLTSGERTEMMERLRGGVELDPTLSTAYDAWVRAIEESKDQQLLLMLEQPFWIRMQDLMIKEWRSSWRLPSTDFVRFPPFQYVIDNVMSAFVPEGGYVDRVLEGLAETPADLAEISERLLERMPPKKSVVAIPVVMRAIERLSRVGILKFEADGDGRQRWMFGTRLLRDSFIGRVFIGAGANTTLPERLLWGRVQFLSTYARSAAVVPTVKALVEGVITRDAEKLRRHAGLAMHVILVHHLFLLATEGQKPDPELVKWARRSFEGLLTLRDWPPLRDWPGRANVFGALRETAIFLDYFAPDMVDRFKHQRRLIGRMRADDILADGILEVTINYFRGLRETLKSEARHLTSPAFGGMWLINAFELQRVLARYDSINPPMDAMEALDDELLMKIDGALRDALQNVHLRVNDPELIGLIEDCLRRVKSLRERGAFLPRPDFSIRLGSRS